MCGSGGVMLPRFGPCRPGAIATGRRGGSRLGERSSELDDLTQAVEVEQVLGGRCGRNRRERERSRCCSGRWRRGARRGADDEVRISPSAKANDLDALAPKGMVRMGDGDESRRWLG